MPYFWRLLILTRYNSGRIVYCTWICQNHVLYVGGGNAPLGVGMHPWRLECTLGGIPKGCVVRILNFLPLLSLTFSYLEFKYQKWTQLRNKCWGTGRLKCSASLISVCICIFEIFILRLNVFPTCFCVTMEDLSLNIYRGSCFIYNSFCSFFFLESCY